ncbi:hypothetical protein, unlikely [Trypanosoma brucei gambiense DAL972]|uniref:Presenilin enhancer-2 subunit of gamma secretase n=2 Tax=Trypanosoma brucei TaxID=5691 RepID=D0A696_TRYB9|nr:hypothetical protein, unlikely [Trypanosoma brucei gambiense DAL972]RHW67754.1 Presenilin enhancer-2 subunit of gamma secretase [Trypanosoma brucei equiperdum]CBH17197.1 hypothetical protein, unlikely [Trypanosoma brucei gambiense DAL972]|eukprot:XP_011779461.1 hypothetical protein, unlikely [Trypanosoma brucei gambiense DAL972]
MLTTGPLSILRAERLCKIYFYSGFAGLPLLWFTTWLFFRHHAQHSEAIRWYTNNSLRLSVVGGLVVLLWYVVALIVLPVTSPLFALPPSQKGEWRPGFFTELVDE